MNTPSLSTLVALALVASVVSACGGRIDDGAGGAPGAGSSSGTSTSVAVPACATQPLGSATARVVAHVTLGRGPTGLVPDGGDVLVAAQTVVPGDYGSITRVTLASGAATPVVQASDQLYVGGGVGAGGGLVAFEHGEVSRDDAGTRFAYPDIFALDGSGVRVIAKDARSGGGFAVGPDGVVYVGGGDGVARWDRQGNVSYVGSGATMVLGFEGDTLDWQETQDDGASWTLRWASSAELASNGAAGTGLVLAANELLFALEGDDVLVATQNDDDRTVALYATDRAGTAKRGVTGAFRAKLGGLDVLRQGVVYSGSIDGPIGAPATIARLRIGDGASLDPIPAGDPGRYVVAVGVADCQLVWLLHDASGDGADVMAMPLPDAT